jgi:PhnB protein
MIKLSPNLTFNGQCEAAFKFYERCLDGKITFMLTWGDSPMADQAPAEWRDRIFHASLKVGDDVLAGGDVLPGQYVQPKGFSIMLGIDDLADAERMFHALSENGTVQFAIQKTFWSQRFGALVDRFGTPWAINCEQAP